MSCPCHSGQAFNSCCEPYLTNHQHAVIAEALMRSRFSAYTLGEFQYIYDTYGEEEQKNLSVELLKEGSDEQQWMNLVIHEAKEDASPKQVTFSAFYLMADDLYELKERSYFATEYDKLKYISGDILVHDKIKRIKRNDACPCQSGKKYKKCCQKA